MKFQLKYKRSDGNRFADLMVKELLNCLEEINYKFNYSAKLNQITVHLADKKKIKMKKEQKKKIKIKKCLKKQVPILCDNSEKKRTNKNKNKNKNKQKQKTTTNKHTTTNK